MKGIYYNASDTPIENMVHSSYGHDENTALKMKTSLFCDGYR